MVNSSANNKRIAKNTLLLYVRMLFMMAVSLYTSRVVLNALGVEDFGIYNVVGGVVTMFSVLSGSLSAAISRFITYELGKGNKERLNIIFSSSVMIQAILALSICFLAEIIGVWFLNSKMNIPEERIAAANWVMQCSILTFMINLISVPYNATIIAHERMKVFAYVSILEVVLKLVIVFLLYISMFDKLMTYSVLLVLVALIIRFVYGYYCKKHFEECDFHFVYDRKVLKDISGFAGWNFIGSSSGILRDHGGNIVINLFCGPAVNAARGIATQVHSAVYGFVTNFMIALDPQITKNYAQGNKSYLMFLLFQGSRFAYYLLLLLSLPIIFEAEFILSKWLTIVPEHTVNFVRLVLIFSLSESISRPLIAAQNATGKIRDYQIVVGGLQMLNLPIIYVLLRMGYMPESVFIVSITISQCCLAARLYMLRSSIAMSARMFLRKVYLTDVLVTVASIALPIIFIHTAKSWPTFIINCVFVLLCTLLSIMFIGCNHSERVMFLQKAKELKHKFISKK